MARVKTIHKRDICRQVAESLGVSPRGVGVVVNAFLEELAETLRVGRRVELRGFGAFRPRQWAQRRVVTPDGVVTRPEDSRSVGFTPGKKLRGLRHKSG